MTQISIKNFIEEAKKYMIDNSNKVNADKIIPFEDIETFLETKLDEKEVTFVIERITLLKKQITERANKELSEFGDDFVSSRIKIDCLHLGIIYLLMIRTNKEEVLKINDQLLYLVTNAIRDVPYLKYDESINKMLYPDLMKILIQEGATLKSSIILNMLPVNVIEDQNNFDETKLEEYMSNFLIYEVYYRVGIPLYIVGEERMKMELLLNKHFILETIKTAKELKSPYASKFNDKCAVLDTYNSLDIPTAAIYLEFTKWLSKIGKTNFQQVNLQLTALGVNQIIDITTIEKRKLAEIVFKVENIPYKNYATVLGEEKHI